ncbi:metal-dependent hydrolase family protein [Actinomadura rubrisoli]|uniref:Amidohydrolase family protein n=1 Tax=Actinomadura rubrisoli TaxID=2530368 RepID=A0A4R5C5R2_9ACTN|nr:amidohydrolase family protein [Actinomadura rubrisoli]TDD93856.1 amidohydrolase family protein [Actinomadura rubrisoli]
MAADVTVTADRAWDGESEKLRGYTEVRIRDGHITHVFGERQRRDGREAVDLGDVTLLPGLIDCHVHLVTQHEGPVSAALRALPALRDLLHNGFTTVRDLGCPIELPVTIELRRAVDDGLVEGPRLSVAPQMISASGGHGDLTPVGSARRPREGAVADGEAEILRTVREQARAGADWIKFAASGGFTSPVDGPRELGFTEQEVGALVAAARDRGLPTACHVFGDAGVRRAVTAGVSTIEHATLASDETLTLIADRRIPVVPTQYAVSHFLERLDDDSFWRDERERAKFRTHAQDLRAGLTRIASSAVEIAFGTDAGMFEYAANWREFPTLVRSGVSPLRALRAATTIGARVLGREDIGRLEPGCRGDLVAVPGNPLDDIEVMGDVRFVMKDGTIHRCPVQTSGGGGR